MTSRPRMVHIEGVEIKRPMNLNTFFAEKDFETRTYEVEANGQFHIITTDVVIEAILRTEGAEREGVVNIVRQLDFRNGNFHHFFQHLATAIANGY